MAQGTYTLAGHGPALLGVFILFMSVTTVTLALRIYVRTTLVKAVGPEDWAAAIGWLLFMVHAGLAIEGIFHGAGQHNFLIQPFSEIPIALKYWWICEPIWVLASMSIKFSISLMLLRLVVERYQRLLIYFVTILIALSGVMFFFLFTFQCWPISFFWTRFQGAADGRCLNPRIIVDATYAYSGVAVLYHGTMAILPWFLIRKLQLNLRTRLQCAFILALASIASVATIARIPYIHTLADSFDFLYSTSDFALWSTSEIGLSLTASCAATLKPLFKGFMSRGRASGLQPAQLVLNTPLGKAAKQRYIRTIDMDIESTLDATQNDEWVDASSTPTNSVQHTAYYTK